MSSIPELRSFAHLCGCAQGDTALLWFLVEAAGDGDAGLAEDVRNLCLSKAGRVVFEREMALGVIELEAAEAIGVGEFAEGAELVISEGRLQFEFSFEKCHGEIIAEESQQA